MKRPSPSGSGGNALLITLATILILSAIGANVLSNLTTRYNATTNQVRGWKQAQHAAEAAGDIAYAEVRKTILDPTNAFAGWTQSGDTYTSPTVTLGEATLQATVDKFYTDATTGSAWYRIRAKGTIPLQGLKRVTMDDRMGPNTHGDSLLRKIDFNYDHFTAAYGPNGDGVGKAVVPVAFPQLTRRIELIAAPLTPFDAAIKAQGTFYGLGSAAMIDSYDSANGAYYFCASNPSDPHFADSRSGNVQIGSAVATVMGMLYGNLATNGGTVVRSDYVTGTIDNNVPFTLPPFKMPSSMPLPQSWPTSVTGNTSITPAVAGTAGQPTYYLLSAFSGGGKLTINPSATVQPGQLTYVAIRVTNDVSGSLTLSPGVRAQIFIDGNLNIKARDFNNQSGLAGNMQIYGISPTDSTRVQQFNISPPGNFQAAVYAPSADYNMNGNPDIIGALVCKTFYGNGNTSWHYDRALDTIGDAIDYRISSYVEDIR